MFKSLESKVTPFGGLHVIHKLLCSKKFGQFIDKRLGPRVKTIGYHYSELLLTRIYTSLCGGSATEDVNYIREHTLEGLKHFRVPSADTILRGDMELATDPEYLETTHGSQNKIAVNQRMNELLIGCAHYFEMFHPDEDQQDLVYDFDHQFIEAEKYDATYSYKKAKGYFPAVVSVKGVPVYIEGRNGNCHVKTAQLNTHISALDALHKQGIYPKRARMDAGSYIQEVTDFFDRKDILFTIRANQSPCLQEAASKSNHWDKFSMGYQEIQATSLAYQFGHAAHRVVAYRIPNKTGQLNAFTADAYKYLFIITNDWEMSNQQVIAFYNQRGASEKVFDVQNNDFNWNCMPHSFLEQNTVYLIIMAIAHIVYKWLIKIFSNLVENLPLKARLKQFIFRLVATVARITQSGRRQIVALATKNQKLIQFINSS